MNELALFAGAGGGILAGKLLGWRTVCAVECDAYAAQILAQRQNDRTLRPFPVWSDVRSFDGRPWRGVVDVISAGFPCQDISAAGRGAGINGKKSGLWTEAARIIGEVRPALVYLENSPLLRSRGLDKVAADLAKIGYDCRWMLLSAADLGAPHRRNRIWILAYPSSQRGRGRRQNARRKARSQIDRCYQTPGQVADADGTGYGASALQQCEPAAVCRDFSYAQHCRCQRRQSQPCTHKTSEAALSYSPWPPEPRMGRVVNGVAHRADRIRALGNGQVPRVAAAAFTLLNVTRQLASNFN
ncbi:MAG: DNA cytosine methyltransferase [Methylomonas sp.]|nr:MAG: DNA cytosine methyltransferase [Methylomonas sp.]